MKKTIEIVDRGRGPQLSTSRITVQDLVPYFQRNLSGEQIREIIPVLTLDEIHVAGEYVRANFDAVMDQDRRIRERNANRKNPPEVEAILERGGKKMAALREEFARKKRAEKNGDQVDG